LENATQTGELGNWMIRELVNFLPTKTHLKLLSNPNFPS